MLGSSNTQSSSNYRAAAACEVSSGAADLVHMLTYGKKLEIMRELNVLINDCLV